MKIPSAALAAVITLTAIAAAAVTASTAGPTAELANVSAAPDGSISHGRYLVAITGCQDCHTVGYSQTGGHVPSADWLTGSAVGFQGPWGTSYAANLRLTVQSLTEAQWLVMARAERRPPMPWLSLKSMSDRDLADIYWYIRSLGPSGEEAPAAVPPGGKVNTPFIIFQPQNLGRSTVSQTAAAGSEPRS